MAKSESSNSLNEYGLPDAIKDRIHAITSEQGDQMLTLLLNGQEYNKEETDEALPDGWTIGCNHAGRVMYGGCRSSFDNAFTNQDICILGGMGDHINTKLGDVKEAYGLLQQKLIGKENIDTYKLFEIILETVDEYFGGLGNIANRMKYYRSSENKISNLKGSGAAMCVERAALSQNLLQMLGINSFYKSSGIIKNGSHEIHSYNLVEYNGRYYIFDSTMPNIIKGKPNPLIAEVNEDAFKLISSRERYEGISITVSHYNPYQEKEYTVTYDDGRKKSIEVSACK